LEIDTEAHDNERQCLADSMCTRCLPRLNEIERPAWADEPQADQPSVISTARKQSRFIKASRKWSGRLGARSLVWL
jgi:hypothetical protein